MVVRVVPHAERRALAYAAAALAMIVLPLALFDDLVLLPMRAPHGGDLHLAWMRPVVEFALWSAAFGPLSVFARRLTRRVVVTDGAVHGLPRALRREDVRALSVAAGAKGYSVGVVHGDGVRFLEVERVEDARTLRAALSAVDGAVAHAGATLERGARRLVRRARLAWLAQLALGIATAVATLDWHRAVAQADNGSSGIVAVSLALMSVAFFVGRVRRGDPLTIEGGESILHHADLHRDHALAQDALAVEPERAGLARGGASIAAWFRALDATSAQAEHAYRGHAMTHEALARALEEAPSLEIKMAAARVLARRHGQTPEALVRIVTDPDERVRVAASLREPEEAADELERLGPMFRAR